MTGAVGREGGEGEGLCLCWCCWHRGGRLVGWGPLNGIRRVGRGDSSSAWLAHPAMRPHACPPTQVPEAVCLPSMTYHEAWELSYFGANVLHPRTTLPAMKYHIPITIRNFFNLTAPGEPLLPPALGSAAAAPCIVRSGQGGGLQGLALGLGHAVHNAPHTAGEWQWLAAAVTSLKICPLTHTCACLTQAPA